MQFEFTWELMTSFDLSMREMTHFAHGISELLVHEKMPVAKSAKLRKAAAECMIPTFGTTIRSVPQIDCSSSLSCCSFSRP